MIPQQLYAFKFCLLDGKKPFETNWTKETYSFDDITLQRWINVGNNYGVIGGSQLVIVDVDSQEEYDRVKDNLPPTFTVRTATRKLFHLYYLTDDTKGYNWPGGEVRGDGQQVVGPYCKIGDGTYTIENDIDIARIDSQDLRVILKHTPGVKRTPITLDESGSGKDFRLIKTMLQSGLSKSEIYAVMATEGHKWKREHISDTYRESTYNNALTSIESAPQVLSQEEFLEAYELIEGLLREYLILREEYYPIIATWIIGTYSHKAFETYPYLFINAMKGSGKSRLLKLIAALSHNGEVLASLREAVLFRTAAKSTICIDEFEQVASKEKADLRELLNAAYKKGTKVKRMRKASNAQGESQEVEEFEVFCPIAIANITGMDEVLGDRCIYIIIERSSERRVSKLIEQFGAHPAIFRVKQILNQCSSVDVEAIKQYTKGWNQYIRAQQIPSTSKYYTTTLDTQNYTNYTDFYRKIDETDIEGRYLELFFPLFLVAHNYATAMFDTILTTATALVNERKTDNLGENRDILFVEFISTQTDNEYVSISVLTNGFKKWLNEPEENVKWLHNRWIGHAFKRHNLIIKKRRLGNGVEVIMNIPKARAKMGMFKPNTLERYSGDAL